MMANLDVSTARFIKSAAQADQYPVHSLPEIAFAGRSNVGKSSLINTLLDRKNLVRTSSTPGRTQLLNFFLVNEDLCFVDLPGYGYAKVPKAIKKKWGAMIGNYLAKRTNLRGVVLILDVRRVPSEDDIALLKLLGSNGVPVLPVVTKIDKIARSKRLKSIQTISSALKGNLEFIPFSSVTREGRMDIWSAVEDLLSM